MDFYSNKNILIAPLDWGLGHATRCIPLINFLISKNIFPIIAGSGRSILLLKELYPSLFFYELPSYNINYPANKNAAIQTLLQLPKVLNAIQNENILIQKVVAEQKINLIISDNRYGAYHTNCKSIFLGHQLKILPPKPFQFCTSILFFLHKQKLQNFNEIWIPDNQNDQLCGKLAHHLDIKIPIKYIGIQSRFLNYIPSKSIIENIDFDYLILLSGPEPQRTILEQKLLQQIKNINKKFVIVQGKTEVILNQQNDNFYLFSYLNTNDLFVAIQKAKVVICRSGYSTIMDLIVMQKKAIFIPTPGQTEQEYLAKKLANKNCCFYQNQDKINLKEALQKVENCKVLSSNFTNSFSNALFT